MKSSAAPSGRMLHKESVAIQRDCHALLLVLVDGFLTKLYRSATWKIGADFTPGMPASFIEILRCPRPDLSLRKLANSSFSLIEQNTGLWGVGSRNQGTEFTD